MNDVDPLHDVEGAEAWFVAHGLPYFVDSVRDDVHRGLTPARLRLVALVAVALGLLVGVPAGLLTGDVSLGITLGTQVALVVALVYALTTLRARAIAMWAVRRTLSSLRLLFPLVTRALPLLLIFVTFLFINAEVWEVAATLDGGVMWLTVLLFAGITVGFLLVRLPEELAVLDRDLDPERVVAGSRGTPMQAAARAWAGSDLGGEALTRPLAGLQKANLVLVLLITQLVQVFLLSLSVLVFFLVFGIIAMDPDVVAGWVGEVHGVGSWFGADAAAWPFLERLNRELVQVAVFLSVFSGLYFTVYAVTDETYRQQFFTSIVRELERAVSTRVAYRVMRSGSMPAPAVAEQAGDRTGPAQRVGHWGFVQQLPDDVGGGLLRGELLYLDDGTIRRRYGGPLTTGHGTVWRFGHWRAVQGWEPAADEASARRALQERGYELHEPGPVPAGARDAGPFPGPPEPVVPL